MDNTEEKEETEICCSRGSQPLLRRYQRGPDTGLGMLQRIPYLLCIENASPCLDPEMIGSSWES